LIGTINIRIHYGQHHACTDHASSMNESNTAMPVQLSNTSMDVLCPGYVS